MDPTKVTEVLKVLIWRGSFFPFLDDFGRFWTISGIFGPDFSVFLFFSSLEARVSKATKSRLMYSSSRNKVKAPQLGPRGYRIFHSCPACGFTILYRACLAQIELGPAVSTSVSTSVSTRSSC
jgi:hypothetical protein